MQTNRAPIDSRTAWPLPEPARRHREDAPGAAPSAGAWWRSISALLTSSGREDHRADARDVGAARRPPPAQRRPHRRPLPARAAQPPSRSRCQAAAPRSGSLRPSQRRRRRRSAFAELSSPPTSTPIQRTPVPRTSRRRRPGCARRTCVPTRDRPCRRPTRPSPRGRAPSCRRCRQTAGEASRPQGGRAAAVNHRGARLVDAVSQQAECMREDLEALDDLVGDSGHNVIDRLGVHSDEARTPASPDISTPSM